MLVGAAPFSSVVALSDGASKLKPAFLSSRPVAPVGMESSGAEVRKIASSASPPLAACVHVGVSYRSLAAASPIVLPSLPRGTVSALRMAVNAAAAARAVLISSYATRSIGFQP
jgi:hypothetical protein